MKKLLVIAILMLALVFTVVACDKTPDTADTTAPDTTAAETPTEAPDADTTEAPTAETPTDPADDPTEAPTAAPEDPTDDPETPTKEPDTTEAPTEAPTADPAEPALIIEPDFISAQALDTNPTVANHIGSAEVMTEGNRTFVRLTSAGGDPYVAVVGIGSNYTLPGYMAVVYRTNATVEGQFFMGSGAGWGAADCFNVNWNEGEDWNLLVVDLSSVAGSVVDGLVNFARLDFFAGNASEGDYFDVQYIGFFNTAEYALDYDFKVNPPYVEIDSAEAGKKGHSFDTFYVNGEMFFQPDGGHGDKLTEIGNTVSFPAGKPHDSMVLRGWIGFDQPIASFGYFIDNYTMVYGDFAKATEDGVLAAGGEFASRFEILVPLTDLEGGVHTVGFVVKLEDGTVVRLRENLKVVIIPETENETVTLASGHGNPFSGAPNTDFGQRFNIGDALLKRISITDMATYSDGGTNTWSFKIWQWNTDYETTTSAAPLYFTNGENHADNTTFNLDIPDDLYITGEIYYQIAYISGSGCFTGWTADTVAEGVETYVGGVKKEGSYGATVVVGTPVGGAAPEVTPDHQLQNPPVFMIKAKDMAINAPAQLTSEKMDGYVHFVPTGGDPCFMLFNNQTGSRYVSIKYRTEYQANIQIFLGSTGAGPVDDTTMLEQALIPDGEWHLAIFDTQTLVDRGVYDGSTAAFLRLDVMESGYECDENGDPIRDEDGTWHKLPLPEGATIDIAYFAFFDTEEKANRYEYAPVVTDKTTYVVGEPIMISATGTGTDWVGIAAVDATETLRWWYVESVGAGVAINALNNSAVQPGTGAAIGDLPAGEYYVVWVPNDQAMNGAEGLCRYLITVVEDPNKQPYEVDLTKVSATGSFPNVDDPVNGGIFGQPDLHVISLHYGSINLGELDLSKYSKVTVTYATPSGEANGSDFTAEYEATGKRVLLLNAPSAIQDGTAFEYLPADGAVITSAHYEISETYGQITTVEIDLSDVTYNGQVYLSFDARNANNEFGALGYLVYVMGIHFDI